MTLQDLLTRQEGRKNRPYECSLNHKTIGVGHLMSNGLPPHILSHLEQKGFIADDMIDELLEVDIRHAVADVRSLFPGYDTYSQDRKNGLVSWVFQCGYRGVKGFKNSVRAINEGRWNDVERMMAQSLWYQQTPNRAKEVIALITKEEASLK